MGEHSSLKTPTWDGKANTAAIYVMKLIAVIKIQGHGDALDEIAMKKCPDKNLYASLQENASRSPEQDAQLKLYRSNETACAMFVVGQSTAHGLNMLTKTMDPIKSPDGLIHKALHSLKNKYQPSDTSAEIELESQLEAIEFSDAGEYYNNIIACKSRFGANVSETTLIKAMAKQVMNPTYMDKIMAHLKQAEDDRDFEKLCEEIGSLQRMCKSTNATSATTKVKQEKEVQLTTTSDSKWPCRICNKKGHKTSDCPVKKAEKNKTCGTCGMKGHISQRCFTAHPELIPPKMRTGNGRFAKLYKKWKEQNGTDATGCDVEVMIPSVDQDFCLACQL